MALQKTYEIPSGISGNYWKIMSISLEPIYKIATINLCLYFNSDARENEKQVLWSKNYHIRGDDYMQYFATNILDTKNPIKSCYEYLKTTSEFSDSVDV